MAFTTPGTAVAGEVLTAAFWNSNVRDNTQYVYDHVVYDVKQSVKTDTFSASLATGAATAITGLTITHTMQRTTNRIVLIAYVSGSQDTDTRLNVGLSYDGSLASDFLGGAASSRVRVGSGNRSPDTISLATTMVSGIISPGNTSSHTYGVHIINQRSTTKTMYVNRSAADTDSVDVPRGTSNILLFEVGAA